MKPELVLGIMSGTSLGGADYALCHIGLKEIRLVALWSVRYPPALQRQLDQAAQGCLDSHSVARLHHALGRFYARAALRNPTREQPRLVGLHGQTIYHQPDRRRPATLQLGEPAYLAHALRVPVISNFRATDMAAGGQGAPLATAFHLKVFAQQGRHVCVNNLGGISNVTSLDGTRGRRIVVRAFDTGPANMLLDLAARRVSGGRQSMDRDGRLAAQGRVCEPLVATWLQHPFFRQPPPKARDAKCLASHFSSRPGGKWPAAVSVPRISWQL